MIGIIDYGLGNVRAFANIFRELDVQHKMVTTVRDLADVAKLILPGVGAFDRAMRRLDESGLREELERRVLMDGVPLLGVCVGMQMLVNESEEGTRAGLGWIDGQVLKFPPSFGDETLGVPHMGWNTVEATSNDPLFAGLDTDSYFYFLHSYFVHSQSTASITAFATYGTRFAAAIRQNNVAGVQFHPEKSHQAGIQLLKNFSVI